MFSYIWTGKRVLITGHTGFKGSWLSQTLNLMGAQVSGFSLPPTLGSHFEFSNNDVFRESIYSDIRDIAAIRKAIEIVDPDIIFHLAAQPLVLESLRNPIETFEINVNGTINLMESARLQNNLKGIVVITTDKVYSTETFEKVFTEDSKLFGKDPYSASKVCAEMVVSAWRSLYAQTSNANLVTARAGNVIGGGDISRDRLIPDTLRAYRSNEVLEIRNPMSIRPWQHVLDPIFGYIKLGERMLEKNSFLANSYNFGPNSSIVKSVMDVINEIKGNLTDLKVNSCEDSDENQNESRCLLISSELASQDLSWRSKLNFSEAIKWTLDWEFHPKSISKQAITESQISTFLEMRS